MCHVNHRHHVHHHHLSVCHVHHHPLSISHKAILRRIGNEMFLLFRVVEARKLQVCEAHVRCYAVKHGEREDGTPLLFQQHVMRIMQPDDELGGMLLLMLPTEVIHQVSV